MHTSIPWGSFKWEMNMKEPAVFGVICARSRSFEHLFWMLAPTLRMFSFSLGFSIDYPSHLSISIPLISSWITGTWLPAHVPFAEVGIFRSLGGFQTLQEKKFGKGAPGWFRGPFGWAGAFWRWGSYDRERKGKLGASTSSNPRPLFKGVLWCSLLKLGVPPWYQQISSDHLP